MPDARFSVDGMTFIYDLDKEEKNKRNHGLSFRTAAFVFKDTLRLDFPDEAHSTVEEERWITIGLVNDVLTVVYCERQDESIEAFRLISARYASPAERRLYNDSVYGRRRGR